MSLMRQALLVVVGLAGLFAAVQLPLVLRADQTGELIENAASLSESQITERLKQLSSQEIAGLTDREIARLRSDPLDAKALQNLSMLLAMRGKPEQTQNLNLQIARYSLRNVGAQLIAINLLVGQGDFDEALFRLDAVLRAEPAAQKQLFATLMVLAENKASMPAVAKVLKQQPPWRRAFMTHVAANESTGQLTYRLLKAVGAIGGELPSEELRNILASWVKSGEFERAYFVWLDLLSNEEIKSLKLVYDGQFSRESRNQFFDWNFNQKPNVRIGIARRPGSAVERSLQLDFYGYKGGFSNVSQMWRLSPGAYDISFDHMAQSLNAAGGLRWRVKCIGASTLLGESSIINTSVPWNNSVFSIAVPEEGCDTQLLRLETASRAALDTALTGQIYFDDFKVERKEAGTPQ